MNDNLVNKIVQALVHSILSILKFIFVTPLNLWLKAIERLNAQKAAGTLEMANIQSEWPLLAYIKRFTLDFYFDAVAFLVYPLGVLVAFYDMFAVGFDCFVAEIIAIYFFPISIYIFHDLTVIALLPIRKLIDWFKKPAQHMDLDIKNK